VAKLDKTTEAVYRQRVLEDYARDQPEPADVDKWFAAEAEKIEWDEKSIRRVIADQIDQLSIAAGQRILSVSQRVANILGVTQGKAIRRLDEALDATKLIVKGDPKNGYETFEHPDWPSRIDAIHELLSIHGSHAPTRAEFSGKVVHEYETLTDDELSRHIAQRLRGLREHESRTGSSDPGADGAQSSGGPLLLDDGMHQDQGRTEPARPVQAVPEETVSA
jgi:hypothetical protein